MASSELVVPEEGKVLRETKFKSPRRLKVERELKGIKERLGKSFKKEKLKGKKFLKKGKRPTFTIKVPPRERSEPKPFFSTMVEDERRNLFF